jgi:hypothetical protein
VCRPGKHVSTSATLITVCMKITVMTRNWK